MKITIKSERSANMTPERNWDYIASIENDSDEGDAVTGLGESEEAAILALFEQILNRGYL